MVRPDEAGKWPLVQFFIHIRARNKGRWGEFEKIYEKKDVDVSEAFEETISIKLPSELRNNGSVTLFLLMVDNEYNEKEKTSTVSIFNTNLNSFVTLLMVRCCI